MNGLKLIPVVFVISILVLAVPFSAFAISYFSPVIMYHPNPNWDQFGFSVVYENENVIVSAAADDVGALESGAVYIFDKSGTLQLTLLNPYPSSAANFGNSISADGDNVLVGAWRDNLGATASGVAYLFNLTTCDADISNGGVAADGICEGPTLSFENPTPVSGDHFGQSVSINGANVLIGSDDDTGAIDAGAAYLFDITTCDDDTTNGVAGDDVCETATLTLLNPTPVASDNFGDSVSVWGNGLVIGTNGYDSGVNNSGAVYYFDLTTCDADISNGGVDADGICEAATLSLLNPTPDLEDRFGNRVLITGTKIIVGASNDDFGATNSGVAYLFDIASCDADTSNGGSAGDDTCEAATLTFLNPTPATSDSFGTSIAMDGNNVLVGAWGDSIVFADEGAAYLFDITTCDDDTSNGGSPSDNTCEAELNIFQVPNSVNNYFFGVSVSLSGNDVLVGSMNEFGSDFDSGGAYLFLEDAGTITASVNILGTCGITFVGGNTIAYNDLEPGATSTEEVLAVQNTGTVASNVLVSGTDWVDATPVTVMLVGETAYSDTTGNYASKTSLSGTPVQILDDTQYIPDATVNTYWQLLANLIDPDFVGSLTQEMTFTVDC